MSKTVTAADVARVAGVSRSMVSRAFREGAYVAPEQKRRILHICKEMGYQPNPLARALISRRTPFVGVVTSGLSNPMHAELYGAMIGEMQGRGLVPLTFQMTPGADGAAAIEAALASMEQYRVAQIVLTSFAVKAEMLDACLGSGRRVHLLNRADERGRTGAVSADVGQGGTIAAHHLIDAGRCRIAILDGAAGAWTAIQRASGYLRGLEEAGLAPVLRLTGDYTEASGLAAATALAAARPLPDAVLCANDLSACGMIEGLRRAGLRVPEDIAVVGFDDIPQAAWAAFDLTTVRLPVRAMVRLLCDRLENGDDEASVASTQLLPCALVRRGSA